jgi:hypothetical protein
MRHTRTAVRAGENESQAAAASESINIAGVAACPNVLGYGQARQGQECREQVKQLGGLGDHGGSGRCQGRAPKHDGDAA